MKHTEGKWKTGLQDFNTPDFSICVGVTDMLTARAYGYTPDDATANGKLIAAAPLLLEALQKITEMNYQNAEDKYGNRDVASGWSCVTVAEFAIKQSHRLTTLTPN